MESKIPIPLINVLCKNVLPFPKINTFIAAALLTLYLLITGLLLLKMVLSTGNAYIYDV